MNVSDIIHGQIITLDLRRADAISFPEGLCSGSEVFLHTTDWGGFLLTVDKEVWEVEGTTSTDRDTLWKMGLRDLPRLAWLVKPTPTQGPADNLLVQVHQFPSTLHWNEPMEIGVDDRLVDDVRRRYYRRARSGAEIANFLNDCVLLPASGSDASRSRWLLSGSTELKAFRLLGEKFAVDVKHTPDDRLQAFRVVPLRRAHEDRIYLGTGQCQFCDLTLATQFRGIARTELDILVSQADSYLALWHAYNEKEHQIILKRAQQFKWVRYTKRAMHNDGTWEFHIDNKDKNSRGFQQRMNDARAEQFETGDTVPQVIQGINQKSPKPGFHRSFTGEFVSMSPGTLRLRPPGGQDSRPPQGGYIFVSLQGDTVRMKRREQAWQAIRHCRNPMPQLGLLLENNRVPEPRSRHLQPVTKGVRKILPTPNDQQRLALEVALNTPDIALIQGPPGTGKTQVVAALQARLAEKDEVIDPFGLMGNTLLTSYQHDAVAHAANATRVMGLPAVKVGNRRRSNEPEQSGIETWRQDTAQKVRGARSLCGVSDEVSSVDIVLDEVREIVTRYLQAPSGKDIPVNVLRDVLERARLWLPGELVATMEQLCTTLSEPGLIRLGNEDRAFALKAVRALRTEAVAFSDDGPDTAYKVLRRLDRIKNFKWTDEARSCLELALNCSPEEEADEKLLQRLQFVKNDLIDQLSLADNGIVRPGVHADVAQLLMRAINALDTRVKETTPGVALAVKGWLDDLEGNPAGIADTLQHYTMVLAATCQQSVSRSMIDERGENKAFRNIIVDEAARANPLDLMIPMSLAERRIVLVGDHRQIPHLLEPDIERELDHAVQSETHSALKQSLFEKLFIELRKREQRDKIKRTVTLDRQYRMHPLLGQFVSKQFYEPYGEGFVSGRDGHEFAHDVSLQCGTSLSGKVAAWIDVHYKLGPEESGRSQRRPVEACRVAQEAYAILQDPALRVGIITFYAAQRDEILRHMRDFGLAEDDDEGGFRIQHRWRRTSDGHERLRVGTVDAFQGKEFDIVLLSLTRSNREKTERRRYGFLTLENRLCVAMSRQHRLLMVIGDLAMATGPEARSAVPSLSAFREFCEEPHGIIIRS